MFFEQMHPTWQNWLAGSRTLLEDIESQVVSDQMVPDQGAVMRAFRTNPEDTRVILIGQDPYPVKGQAIGLSFAMNPLRSVPRSLRNIAVELEADLGFEHVGNKNFPDLARWAESGVMLLNRALTTIEGVAGAHLSKHIGWQDFTFLAVEELLERHPRVLMLWGNAAGNILSENDSRLNTKKKFIAVQSAHPSPLSANRGFFGSKPFSRANQAIGALDLQPIDWTC